MKGDWLHPSIPPLFKHFPVEISQAEVISSFPEGTFLENIAAAEDGMLFVTSLEEGVVYCIEPNGIVRPFAKINGKPAGIILLPDNTLLVNGWDVHGRPSLYAIDKTGSVKLLHQPAGAIFLNGMASLSDEVILICDSFKGCLWAYNRVEDRVSSWLSHNVLAKLDSADQMMPAANGIKIYDRAVFVSNTEKRLLIRIPVRDEKPGDPEVYMDGINLDDFAFDTSGNLFAATHIYNSVIKITPQKRLTVIGTAAQGLVGSTAVALGRTNFDKNFIYITTNGGMSLPYQERLQNARVVKLQIF